MYTTMRYMVLSLMGNASHILFIGIILIYIIYYFVNYPQMKIKITKTPFWLCYSLMFIFVFMSLAILPLSNVYALYEYVFYFLMIFASFYIVQFLNINWLINVYLFFCTLLSIEAMWEFYTGNIIYRVGFTFEQARRRSYGLVGSPLTLGMVLACSSIMSLYMITTKSKKYIFVMILNLLGMFCSQSRGPIVSFIIGIITAYVCKTYSEGKNIINQTIKIVIGILFLIIFLYLLITFLGTHFIFFEDLFIRLSTIFVWNEAEMSNFARMQHWMTAIDIFKQNPIIGQGVSSTGNHGTTGFIPESGILKTFVETGILGSILYFGTIYGGVFSLLSRKNHSIRFYYFFAIFVAINMENIVLQIFESVSVFFILSLSIAIMSYDEREN